ncbi:MAG: hypothetical protein ICV60_10645 [Pyrinomonadaceae bacterium]|nr:hypothetical protein [Pyrinomonadaceae bacterium]
MKSSPRPFQARRTALLTFALLLALLPSLQIRLAAQAVESAPPAASPASSAPANQAEPLFRLERTPVAGGAEILTIFGRLDGLPRDKEDEAEVPLVSVLRDTLGDNDPENDRLRYVWMLTYTRPTFLQRLASGVPFLYSRAGNRTSAPSKGAPPPIIDLAKTDREVWNKFFWAALQNIFLDSYGFPVKAATRSYRRNLDDYRKSHVTRALAILSLYEAETGASPLFTSDEMRDIQARLMLSEKALGGIVDDIFLQRVYAKETTLAKDIRGHNWELLRQRAESEKLYFEPLELPDGSATHAILWVARPDLVTYKDRPFKSRFLNIANPWRDDRLRYWNGYVETRYFDADNREVPADTPGARPVQMIPLAIYGLDHPRVPILLVDFRDGMNPKWRETSRRVLEDITRTVLSLSRFGDIPYFLSRTVYDFVTGRRGMDINQPTRLRTYSQLKLLLSLDASLDPQFRDEINRRLERVSNNPRENGMEAEASIARAQYEALMNYARDVNGLPARLERDRREEMASYQKRGQAAKVVTRLANILSFGIYTRREEMTPDFNERLDKARRMNYYRRFLREAARRTPQIEVVYKMEDVRRALQFVADNGALADGKTAQAAARIFAQTKDDEARTLALRCLYRIDNETAKSALLRIYNSPQTEARWREMSAEYLRLAVREDQRIAPADAKAIMSVTSQ